MKATVESEGILKKVVAERLSGKPIALDVCIEAFEKFATEQFDCADDRMLWETGTYNFTGEDMHECSMVRQFVIETDNEYDHMEQLHMTVYYAPCAELNAINEEMWSTEYNSTDDFFKEVKRSDSYIIPLTKHTPAKINIFFEEV